MIMVTELMTTTDVSALLMVPVATLRYWRHLGRGPLSFKVGRAVRYRRPDVEKWLADQRTATASGGA